jgi:ubiquinone/menaquinone biosynthesis C-methylase UbiE
MDVNINLRTTFNSEAELYNAARPHYPEELFDALVNAAELKNGAKLLEIGPGTGQATESMAKRGYEITGVELGADMADVARRELAQYKNVKIVTGAFEDVEFPDESFDLVFSATAFHWIKPEFKFAKPHRLLKDGGYLAIIGTNHISDESGDEFFFVSLPIYKKYKADEKYGDNFRLSKLAEIKQAALDTNLFSKVYFHAFPLVIRSSAKEYAQLLNTFSPTLAMEKTAREAFLAEIEKLIDEKFGGSLEKHFAMALTLAKKIDSAVGK